MAEQIAAAARIPALVGWASELGDPDGYELLATAGLPAGWVPEPVIRCIARRGLYATGR